ncbi:response regulator transcription factor [Roseivirga sp.]|uniref:response regulator transcription factor n=1 Tax=Roseivirga sp. TaxID=1964215 RepID=UPI003B5238E6
MTNRIQTRKKEILDSLSARELEILEQMANGHSRSEIATTLSISVLTYDEHRKNIRNKLGLQSHADWALVIMAVMS